jgi:hypothetical protein
MKLPTTVIVGTGVSGFIVIIAAIALGWFGFPALISHKIKHVSTNMEQKKIREEFDSVVRFKFQLKYLHGVQSFL